MGIRNNSIISTKKSTKDCRNIKSISYIPLSHTINHQSGLNVDPTSNEFLTRLIKLLMEGGDMMWEQTTWKSNTKTRVLIIEKKFSIVMEYERVRGAKWQVFIAPNSNNVII